MAAADATAPRHIWLDGRVVRADEPHLSVTDRGFQLGDGIFETLRARRGVVLELDEHLRRLHDSAAALEIPLPAADVQLVGGIRDLLEVEGLDADGSDGRPVGDAALRITVSRGPLARRGLLPAGWRTVAATIVIQAWPYEATPTSLLERGVSAVPSRIRRDPSSPLTGVKSTSRADYVLAKLDAAHAGADDALFLTSDGRISEATTANVFAIAGNRLVTPTLGSAVLPGTTRTWLLGVARDASLGLIGEERDLWPDDLLAADEAFLSSSVAGIVPFVAYDGRPIGDGRPGARTLALRAARERWIDEQSLALIALAAVRLDR